MNIDKLEDKNENIIEGETLQRLVSQGSIPCLSAIVIEEDYKRIHIRVEDINQVEMKPKRHGALAGFLVGLTIDVALIAMVVGCNLYGPCY